MVFTDASDPYWEAMATQLPDANLWAGIHPSDKQHAPLAFVSGSFTNSNIMLGRPG